MDEGKQKKVRMICFYFSAKFESSQNTVFFLIKKMYGNIFGFYEKYLIYLIFLLEKILCKGLEIQYSTFSRKETINTI